MNYKEYSEIYTSITKPVSTWYTDKISFLISKPITYTLYKLKITPNIISISVGLLALVAVWTFHYFYGHKLLMLIGLILLQLSYALDCSDGQIARLTNKTSRFGATIDISIDKLKAFIAFCGLFLVEILHQKGTSTILDSSILCVVMSWIITFMCTTDFYALTFDKSVSPTKFAQAEISTSSIKQKFFIYILTNIVCKSNKKFRRLIRLPYEIIDTGVVYLIISLAMILGKVYYVIVFYGILSFLLWLATIALISVQDHRV